MVHRVVLYGAGKRCEQLCQILKWTEIEIIFIADSNPRKWGDAIEGYIIDSPEKLKEYCKEYFCITVAVSEVAEEIRRDLQQRFRYDLEMEIRYNRLILEAYMQCSNIRQSIENRAVNDRQEEHILFDCYNGLVLGGVEAWTMDLCEAFIKSGEKNAFIISDIGDYIIPDCLKEHILYVDIDHHRPFSIFSINNLAETILKKLPCKVITCTTNEVMIAAWLVKLACPDQIRIISVIHNSNEKVYEEYMDFRECPDFYVGVSQDIKRNMIQRGIREDHIDSMTCPFTCEPVLTRTYSEKRRNPIRIGYAGRLEYEQKRMDLLLKLLEVLEERNIPFQMEIAGDGTARRDMEEFVERHYLNNKVHFLGRLERKKISSFWKRQDICVNLADYEGRSITVIEAMGNGAVPIVTATSGVHDDIVEGENGFIIPLEDYDAAAIKIQYLEAHRERLSKMGKMAHDAVYPKSLMEPHMEFWKRILFI